MYLEWQLDFHREVEDEDVIQDFLSLCFCMQQKQRDQKEKKRKRKKKVRSGLIDRFSASVVSIKREA